MKNFQVYFLTRILIIIVHITPYLCQEPFIEPKVLSNFEESFVLNDLEYILTNRRITWEEASIGCSAFEHASLAIINNTEKAKYLALALAETDLQVEDLWVGAQAEPCPEVCNNGTSNDTTVHCKKNSCFKWLTGEYVHGEFMLPRYKEVSVADRQCLSFARNNHQQPSFVDLDCILLRPYICERPAQEEDGEMTHRGWIRIDFYEYAIFYAKKTWQESVRECFRKHSAHLADFRNMKEIGIIGKYLLTGRPSLENAWIGGFFKYGHWRYISIDGIIPNITNNITLYPPWSEQNPNATDGTDGICLLLDRHLDDTKKLIFKPEHCHKRRSYICSRKISGHNRSPFEVIIIDDICYTLYYTPKTWYTANDICIQRNAFLVEVTEDKIDTVLYIMGENRSEVNHIWIGGKLMADNKWFWMNSNDTIDSKPSLFKGYPPWLDSQFDPTYGCLNMDRENHNIPIFYGVYCYEKQLFMCQQYDTEKCQNDVNMVTTLPEPATITTTTEHNPWKWKWPSEKSQYNKLKPFFVEQDNVPDLEI